MSADKLNKTAQETKIKVENQMTKQTTCQDQDQPHLPQLNQCETSKENNILTEKVIYIGSPYQKLYIENPTEEFIATFMCAPRILHGSPKHIKPIRIPIGKSIACFCALDCASVVTLHLEDDVGFTYELSEKNKNTLKILIKPTIVDNSILSEVLRSKKVEELENTEIQPLNISFQEINTSGYATPNNTCTCDMKVELTHVVNILEEICLQNTYMCNNHIDLFKQACLALLFDKYGSGWKKEVDPKEQKTRTLIITKYWNIFPMNLDIVIRKAIHFSGMRHFDVIQAFNRDLIIYFNPGEVRYKLETEAMVYRFQDNNRQTKKKPDKVEESEE